MDETILSPLFLSTESIQLEPRDPDIARHCHYGHPDSYPTPEAATARNLTMEDFQRHACLPSRSALASRQHGTFFSVRLVKHTSQSTKPCCRCLFQRSATCSTIDEQNPTAHPRTVQETALPPHSKIWLSVPASSSYLETSDSEIKPD